MSKIETRINRIMELSQALVDDEVHNVLSNTDGGAPSIQRQEEMNLAIENSRAKLRAELERWIR